MPQHTWKKLDCFPLIFVILFASGIFVPFIIALSNDHVTPYVPYISEGGGTFPEAGIFSVCMSITAFLCQWTIYLRYLVVEELNFLVGNDKNNFLNKISLMLGGLSTVALVVLTSYPASTIAQVHNSAAGVTCVCYVIYLVCNTLITFRISGPTKLSYYRLVITVMSAISLVCITTFGLIGSSQWTVDYWPGKKTPDDKGFLFYVISASFEWMLAILIILYFSTYISEFKTSMLHFQVEVTTNPSKSKISNIDLHRHV